MTSHTENMRHLVKKDEIKIQLFHCSLFREAVDEAFEKWRKSTGLNFVESKSDSADIVISFEDMKDPFLNGRLPLSFFNLFSSSRRSFEACEESDSLGQ